MYYILDENKKPQATEDVLEFDRFLKGSEQRRVALTQTTQGKVVSTVFLGIDHNWFKQGPPLLFETMIFPTNSWESEYCERCSTWDEALKQHEEAVRYLNNLQQKTECERN